MPALVVYVVGLAVVGGCGRIGFDLAQPAQDGGVTDGAFDDAGPDAMEVANRAFVTSTTYDGAFGGLAQADALCQARADAAGLGGTFIARLGTAATPAVTRLAGARGWRDLAGLPIADLPSDWEGGRLIHPLRRDEFGAVVPLDATVWTGPATGAMFPQTCTDWTTNGGQTGDAAFASGSLVAEIGRSCFAPTSLICAERAYTAAVAAVDEPGRFAFVTEATWAANTGRPSADALCASEAAAAGLPGTYLAYLAGPGQAPGARFVASGPPWKVVGGPRLTATAAELVGPTPVQALVTFPGRSAAGASLGNLSFSVGSASNHCQDWSNLLDPARRLVGLGHRVDRRSYVAASAVLPCDNALRLWCLQE